MIIKKCQSGGAYIVRSEEKLEFDLEDISKRFKTLAKTPVLIIIKDKFEITVYKNGKLMIKCSTEKEAGEQTEKIISRKQ